MMNLFGAGILGHSLGTFTDGVLDQLARQQEADGGLDFPAGNFAVVGQMTGFSGDAFEKIVDKAVHDAHNL